MGTNSKLHVQFSDRHWHGLGCNGDTYADTGYQNTWEVTRAQPGTLGILVDYTGGTIGASFGTGTPDSTRAAVPRPDRAGAAGHHGQLNGRATIDFWTGYPWTQGSYSYWKVGQYTPSPGSSASGSGSCHFAGEHTSVDFQGYLNGAVETGERPPDEIVLAAPEVGRGGRRLRAGGGASALWAFASASRRAVTNLSRVLGVASNTLRRVTTLYRCKAPTDLACRCGKLARRMRAMDMDFAVRFRS